MILLNFFSYSYIFKCMKSEVNTLRIKDLINRFLEKGAANEFVKR
jgi:hypothetical protein